MWKLKDIVAGILLVCICHGASGQSDHFFETSLPNGFRIMVYENNELPQAYGAVAVNAGSKHDPADATGMAHYLEHLLFKGTNVLGTTDFEKEKPILDSITGWYDSLGKTRDAAQRLAIQLQINKLSIRAAQYAIPNEMDGMLSEIGSTGVNAFTTAENTVYYNTFPSHQLERWMSIYAQRFENPVFRLFQAELEIVYEEKNRGMDDLFTSLLEVYQKEFYKKHPYGQQTTIGTTEHLKNPPLRKVYEYFYRYYVPNNMALIISGNVKHEEVFAAAQKYFGLWKPKEVPAFPGFKEEEFKGREKIKVRKTPIQGGVAGFRTQGNGHPDNPALRITEYLLSNDNNTGSLDKLVNNRKLAAGGIAPFTLNDYGGTYVYFFPRLAIMGLKRAEKRALNCLEQIKKGSFTEMELAAAKLNLVKRFEMIFESNNRIAEEMLFCFSTGISWSEHMKYPEKLNSVNREEVMRVAKKYFAANSLAMYSRMGRLKKDKLAKPPYDPVKPATGKHSVFYEQWKKIPEPKGNENFYDSEKNVSVLPLTETDTLFHVTSHINHIGRVDIRYKVGKRTVPALKYLPVYISEVNSKNIAYCEFKAQLNALGCNAWVEVFDNSTFVKIHGIDSNLDSAMKVTHAYLYSLKNENGKFKRLLREQRRSQKLERKQSVFYAQRLKEYALFGKKSVFLTGYSHRTMIKKGAPEMLKAIATMFTYEAHVYYVGPRDAEQVKAGFIQSYNPGAGGNRCDTIREVLDMKTENIIYVYHTRKSRQTHMAVFKDGGIYEENKLPMVLAFNRYYGGDMASIVFQEVREFRSLAYTAYGRIEIPKFAGEKMFFETYAACQADKTNETAKVLIELAHTMPEKPERTEIIRKGLREYCLMAVPDDRSKPTFYVGWKRRGFTGNPYQYVYNTTRELQLTQVFDFYKKELQPKSYTLVVVGDKKKINFKELEKLGKVVRVKRSDFISN